LSKVKRMKNNKTYFCLVVLLSLLFYMPTGGKEEQSENEFWDKYGVIVDRNIFSRHRGQKVKGQGKGDQGEKIFLPSPQKEHILIGIARWDDKYIAFLENTRNSATKMYRIGDMVNQGRIRNITLDYLEFELKGVSRKIKIGHNLEGTIYTKSPLINDFPDQPPTSSVSSDPQPKSDSDQDSGDTSEILKKLLERRKKELQQ